MSKKMHSESSDQDTDVIVAAEETRDSVNEPDPKEHGHHHHHHDHEHHDHDHDYGFVEDPSFSLDYKGSCAYEVAVTIPAANRRAKSDEMFEELQDEAQIPGFRRGKAPKSLIQAKFSKAVQGEVLQKLVGGAFQKLVHDEELHPLGMPDIDGIEEAIERGDDDDINFTFKFEVAPRVKLGAFTGLKVERPVLEIGETELTAALEEFRSRAGYFENVEEGGAEEGDQVVIDFEGTIDGEVFAGGSAENYPYFLGSKRFFPEFEAAMVGAEVGKEVTAVVDFPEDYHGKDVAGKQATFKIKINEIKRRKLPELSDELAQEVGFENLADMKEKVSADLREGAREQSQRVVENRLIQQIVDGSTFELPESLIASSATEYYRQELRRLAEMRVPPAEVQKRDPELQAESRKVAEEQIKAFVVVSEIGRAEGISVDESDFAEEARNIQARTGMKIEVVERFLTSENQRSDYESRIFRRKALQVVLSSAEINDVAVSQEELDKQDETADEA